MAVSEYVATKVEGDLPGYRSRARGDAIRAGDDAAGVATLVRHLAEGTAGGDRATRSPKSVEEAYRDETYPVLLRFCQVDTIDALAPLWGRLARGSKGEIQSILQQEFTKVSTGRGLTPDVYCPVVTTAIKQLVTSLNFVAGHGKDDIAVGCQPFLVSYSGSDDHYRALDDASFANQLDQGTANPSLADIREIRDKEKVKVPRDLNQVDYTLCRFAVLAHALFQGPGATNPFVECLWVLSNVFKNRLPVYLGEHQSLQGTAWYDVYPAGTHHTPCTGEHLRISAGSSTNSCGSHHVPTPQFPRASLLLAARFFPGVGRMAPTSAISHGGASNPSDHDTRGSHRGCRPRRSSYGREFGGIRSHRYHGRCQHGSGRFHRNVHDQPGAGRRV